MEEGLGVVETGSDLESSEVDDASDGPAPKRARRA